MNIKQRDPSPVIIPVRPPLGGKNISQPGTDINTLQATDLMNVRFNTGQLQSRNGFGVKYKGLREVPMHLSKMYAANGTLVAFIAIDETSIHQSTGGTDLFMPVSIYDTADALMDLTGTYEESYISTAIGEGTYTPHTINAASIYPATGYAPIFAFTNQQDGIIIVIPSSDGTPLAAEELDGSAVGISGARCVAFFGNRLIVGGTSDSPSEILWSVDSKFEDFTGLGSGSALLGNESERIQNMEILGEYLVVYKERSIYMGRLTGQTTPAIIFDEIPSGGVGLTAPLSLTNIGEEHIFLGEDNVYTLSQSGIKPVGTPVIDNIWGRTGDRGILRGYINKVNSLAVPDLSEYWMMVPSGKFPTAVNLMSDSLMDHYRFTATTTNGSDTLTSITSSEFAYIRIGDLITGTGIPASTTIVSVDASAGELVMSANASASGTVTVTSGNSDGWVEDTGAGIGSTVEATIGGNFGGIYQKLTSTDIVGTYYTTIDLGLGGSAVGEVYSLLLWLYDPTGYITVTVNEADSGGSVISGPSYSIGNFTAHTGAIPLMESFTIAHSNTRKLKISISSYLPGTSTGLDAIQLVAVKDIPAAYRYTYTLYNTYNMIIPGYMAVNSDINYIPLITNEVGPWFCDTVWVYNWLYKSWSCWALPAITGATDINTLTTTELLISELQGTVTDIQWHYDDRLISDRAPSVVIVTPDAQISEIGSQYSYDWQDSADVPILSYWQSKDFNIDLPNTDKTVSRVTLFHDTSHTAVNVTVSVSTDGGANWVAQTVPIRIGHSETFADFFVTGPQARFEVRVDTPGFRLTGFSLKLIPRGEANAY